MGIFTLYELWVLFALQIVPNLIILLVVSFLNFLKSKLSNSYDNSNLKYNKIGWIVFEVSSIFCLAFTTVLVNTFILNLEENIVLIFKICYLIIGACSLYLYIAQTKDTYQENYLNDGDYEAYDFTRFLRPKTLIIYPVLYIIFIFLPLDFLYPIVGVVVWPIDKFVNWLNSYAVTKFIISILSWGILLAVVSSTFSSLRKKLGSSRRSNI